MFLPHLSGGGCPVNDTQSLGAFVGLSNFATKGDLLRALIEGLDYQFLDIVRTMEGLGVPFDHLVVVGGAIRNRFWMQNKADMMGRPIEVPEVEEATPLGAAMLAGIGVGVYRDEQDAFEQVRKPGAVYEPDPELATRYADLFEVYKQIYPALAPVSHALYDRFLG
jgi:xylulokinase